MDDKEAHRLGETHEAVEGHGVIREVGGFRVGNAEGVPGERKASNADIVGNDVARNVTGTVGDLELLVRVGERGRTVRPKEGVGTLQYL